ncbi:MAG: GNAT family N-acetyltransferase [Proteobacteria bacterium]|nr:GNAT family N-acetyltransferase [Pseudomonadota bacterium]
MTKSTLIKLQPHEFSAIESLAVYYEYDMAHYCGHLPGWEFPTSGLYVSKALMQGLKSYFKEKERFPFLIQVDGHPAGFVMVNKVGTTPTVEWNMGEFFVAAPYQRRKIGQTIAKEIFAQFKGEWEVAVIPQNLRAYHFWKGVIKDVSDGKFTEEKKVLTQPEMHQMIIFSFAS